LPSAFVSLRIDEDLLEHYHSLAEHDPAFPPARDGRSSGVVLLPILRVAELAALR
jgi:hypothetical protein